MKDDPARRRVWAAISNLFLDTDVSLLYDSIAEELAASPFSWDELTAILRYEVAPVLGINLLSVAGEWAGFDEASLAEQIGADQQRPRWRNLRRWIPWHRMVARDWAAIGDRVSKLRQAAVE